MLMVSFRYTLLPIWRQLLLSSVRDKPADVETDKKNGGEFKNGGPFQTSGSCAGT